MQIHKFVFLIIIIQYHLLSFKQNVILIIKTINNIIENETFS